MIFEKFTQLSSPDFFSFIEELQKIMIQTSYPKKKLIHHQGSICNHFFMVESGLARVFYYKDDKQVTAHFAAENETFTAIDSFIQRKKSRYNIELLEDSVIWSVSHQDIHNLLDRKPNYEKYARIFLEQIYIELAERVEDLLFLTAKERYERIMDKNPTLLRRVDLKHLASFIGISPETLSRIRKRF